MTRHRRIGWLLFGFILAGFGVILLLLAELICR